MRLRSVRDDVIEAAGHESEDGEVDGLQGQRDRFAGTNDNLGDALARLVAYSASEMRQNVLGDVPCQTAQQTRVLHPMP